MNEQFIMRPGDTFVADECGCSFTVASGPGDENMATQAPTCCCGHQMRKASAAGTETANGSMTSGRAADGEQASNGAPISMAD
jgi:hypothetical protein